MPEQFENEVTITDIQGNATILLDGNNSRIFTLGPLGTSKFILDANRGTLSMFENNDNSFGESSEAFISMSAEDSSIVLSSPSDNANSPSIQFQGAQGTVTLGGVTTNGSLGLFREGLFNNDTNDLSTATIHASGKDSFIQLRNNAGENTIFIGGQNSSMLLGDGLRLDGENGTAILGGNGPDGEIFLRDGSGKNRILIDAGSQRMEISNSDGEIISMIGGAANLRLGTNGEAGNAFFYPSSADNIFNNGQATISLNGNNGRLTSRAVQLRNAAGENTIFISGQNSTMLLGDTLRLNGNSGTIRTREIIFSDGTSQGTAQLEGPRGPRGPQGIPGTSDFSVVQARVFQGAAANRAINTIRADGTIVHSLPIDGQTSDRALKTNFKPIDSLSVLKKLSSVPINQWNWKDEDPDIIHIGPTSQDFHAAFGLGDNDRQIKHVDASGVALASIQALYKLLLEQASLANKQQERIEKLEINLGNEEVKRNLLEVHENLQKNIATLEGHFASISRLNEELARRTEEIHEKSVNFLESIETLASSPADLMAAAKAMAEMQTSFNLQYLELQNQMQSENRSFNLISNVMKLKHDTAKNAISNIR